MSSEVEAAKRLAVLRSMAAAGSSDRQIAETLQMSARSVFRIRKKHDIPSGYKAEKSYVHGRATTYTHYGCRCDECRAANAERARGGRTRRQKRLGQTEIVHGASGYGNWGCRCEVCVAENTERTAPAVKRYRERHREEVNKRHARRSRRDRIETQDRAWRSGYEWTGPELEVAARTDLTAKQAALMLGRTLDSVQRMRGKLRADPKTIKFAGIPRGAATSRNSGE